MEHVKSTSHHELKLSTKLNNLAVYYDTNLLANHDDWTSVGRQIVMIDKTPNDKCTFKKEGISLLMIKCQIRYLIKAIKNMVWIDQTQCKGVFYLSLRTRKWQ